MARTRTRNLSLSLGILGILAASFALLLRSNRQARGLARKRLELVAGVTHELLTPLAALRSAGQNLADGVVSKPEQVRRYGTLVDSEGGRLTRLISQMLELAGIESGQKPFEPASLDVGVALEQALSDCRAALETRRIEVASDIPDDLPAVLADPESLRRALCNLIENAAKYGPEGGRVDLRAAAEGKSRVRVEVLDRGPGISPEDLPHVFEPFYRGREVVASKVQGSGLGLALVQRIMEASGGRISVKNRDGGGSAFALSIPVEPAAKLSS